MAKYTIRHDKREDGRSLLGDGRLALGICLGAVGALLSYLVLELGNGPIAPKDFLDAAPIIISLLVAATSTYLASNALLEQRRTREAGTDPVLIAHLGQREDARELMTFNVTNIGAGAAINVHLDVEEPDDDLEKRNLFVNVFKQHHPFAVILQGRSVEFSLAVGWELLGDNTLPPFQAKLAYEDIEGGRYESEFTIDVREMEKLGANKSPQMRIASALEKIAKK